ncbi:MAG: DUF3365 domain-containing protein [Paracoccaceae bacterium]|nr:DUF3365 domain-containing protein [Paracoccaceae bacterium]
MVVLALAVGLCVSAAPAAADIEADIRLGNALADLLRAGRTVVSSSQPLINDPELGDKGFSGERLIDEAKALYAKSTGASPLGGDMSERDRRLLEAQMLAMQRIVDSHQAEINRKGLGFKGFIPAVFARLANEEFAQIAGKEALIRVTAPMNLVRNRKARPDAWEREVVEQKFLSGDWPKGEPYTETAEYEGRPAFRMLLPEYYRESCLSCHGGPQGETDITGYPKEGGKIGDLGGVISIVIFK